MSDQEIAIKVENVSKDFKLPHLRKNSVKSVFTGMFDSGHGKSTEVQHALKNISFEIKKGEFFGIVCRNGSGKSTLLKMLAGIYQPTKGSLQVNGKLVPFIELGVGFNPELTGRENVFLNGALLGFSRQKIDEMYNDIVEFAELEKFMDQKLKNYSSGMQVRLAFSMAIRADADILLIDEVLAVGDADFQRKCFEYFKSLKRNKKTVVFVSHDMGAIREYCDRVALIDKSFLVEVGAPAKIASNYSRLFIKNEEGTQVSKSSDDDKRWGDGSLLIKNVSIKKDNDQLDIIVKAKSYKELDRVMYGLHIIGQDGLEVTAFNNRMINAPDLKELKPMDEVEFYWRIDDIFNSGEYILMLTLADEAGIAYDWHTEAGRFRISKELNSTTSVLPGVKVSHSIHKANQGNRT